MYVVIAMHMGKTVNSVASQITLQNAAGKRTIKVIIIPIQEEASAAKRQAQGKESS